MIAFVLAGILIGASLSFLILSVFAARAYDKGEIDGYEQGRRDGYRIAAGDID